MLVATPEGFKQRFPEFNLVNDFIVECVLESAIKTVGDCFLECDLVPAQLFLTAHNLFLEGEPARSQNAVLGKGSATAQAIELRDADVQVKYSDTQANLSSETTSMSILTKRYLSSPYGTQYLSLLRKNVGGVRVA